MADRGVRDLELLEGGHQRLRHVAAAELAVGAPAAGFVGVEEPGMSDRRASGEVRAVDAGGACPLDEERDAQRVLGRALSGDPRSFRSGRAVDADRRHSAEGAADVGRVQTARQDDRHLARDRRGELLRHPRPGPARVRAARGVEQDPLRPGSEERPGPVDDRGWLVAVGRDPERLPGGPSGRGDVLGRLVAGELDRVGIQGRDDLRDPLTAGVGGDRDDPGRRGRQRASDARQGDRLGELESARRARDEVQPDRVGTGSEPRRGLPRRR